MGCLRILLQGFRALPPSSHPPLAGPTPSAGAQGKCETLIIKRALENVSGFQFCVYIK